MYPVHPRNRGGRLPNTMRFRICCKRLCQIWRNLGLRLLSHCLDFQRERIADSDTGGFLKLLANPQPMAQFPIRLQRSLKAMAIDGPRDRRPAAPREFCTGILWQEDKGP